MGAAKSNDVYVALLRGINVGGKNKLPMAELVELFEKAGCRDVATYIQSGNLVFQASRTTAAKLPSAIRRAIAAAYGYDVAIVARSAADLRRAHRRNPFVEDAVDVKALHLAFLSARPKAAQLRALEPTRSPGDRFAVLGAEIYLYCPNGLARSKLTNAYFDSNLRVTSTFRNWKTVSRLVEMTDR